MNTLEVLRRMAAEQARGRALVIGAGVSLAWLALVALFAWLAPEPEPGAAQSGAGWVMWLVGVLLPLALVWLAVWSARSLSLLRDEALSLRAELARMQAAASPGDALPAIEPGTPRDTLPPRRRAPPPPRASTPRQPAAEAAEVAELTAPELFHALNFPDGPDDREAIRCLRLALADPRLAGLIRAAQDVVTLLAGQGVYMDELHLPQADPALWQHLARGARGEALTGLAAIQDPVALASAGAMMRSDEVFRDVAQHFLRQFDRLLGERAQAGDAQLLAMLAESRSGRAFLLLAQVSGMLGRAEPAAEAG
ncbi:hypothetical protein [Paracoccus sp. (in: a-proteobacteria)]|uniref:hypothetical protein n=1 Tax=Paracoccus sp. TaxID=267 RepID=UPI0032205C07